MIGDRRSMIGKDRPSLFFVCRRWDRVQRQHDTQRTQGVSCEDSGLGFFFANNAGMGFLNAFFFRQLCAADTSAVNY